MSLSLDELETVIDTALKRALKPDKDKDNKQSERIVFATIANSSASKAHAYPACKPSMICINALDSYEGSIQLLSPAAVIREDNFVTLGIHVESMWEKKDVFKSGTLFAMPIAAALAANILEFAQLKLEMKHADKCWLYLYKRMRAVLRRFLVKVDRYRFLCSQKLLKDRRLDYEYLKCQLKDAFLFDYFKQLQRPSYIRLTKQYIPLQAIMNKLFVECVMEYAIEHAIEYVVKYMIE